MKNTTTFFLLAALVLLAGCSTKEVFFFSKSSDVFSAKPKPGTAENADKAALLYAQLLPPEGLPVAEAMAITASTGPAALAQKPSPVPPITSTSSIPLRQAENPVQLPLANLRGKATELHIGLSTDYQTAPKGRKKAMIGKVEAGFALSLFGLISLALLFISPYFLFFSGLLSFIGLVLSVLGLLQIKKKKDKFRGKVRAWAGIILGLIGAALVAVLLNNHF